MYVDCTKLSRNEMLDFIVDNKLNPLHEFCIYRFLQAKTNLMEQLWMSTFANNYEMQKKLIKLNPRVCKWLLDRKYLNEDIKKEYGYLLDSDEIGLI